MVELGAATSLQEIKRRGRTCRSSQYKLYGTHDDLPLGVEVRAVERAAEILASVHTHDLSGHTLAAIWGDKSNPESLRRAALRGYSLVMSFGTPHSAGSDPKAKGEVRDRLHQYLNPLAGLIQAETRDGKDGNGGKDTLTPLGEDALCVAEQYSKRWICCANRYGKTWYEEVKKDEAAGLDACAKDGKLKR